MKKTYFIFCLIATCSKAFSLIHTVPGNFPTIQAAINASVNGDTVVAAPGTYYENINFRGKNIVVTSQYYLNKNKTFISSTIINGSNPAFADTASCVIFNHGETAAAVLQGFTITGGKGSRWADIHGAGIFREGGGILIEQSSPTILHNFISANTVTNTTGVVATGGGGIRAGDGNPAICSNAILFNQAGYGPGIVLNYTGGRITNNVIASNTGGQKFNGGSGIWAIDNYSAATIVIENNTIVNNTSSLAGGTGGVLIWGCNNVALSNNIIYGNSPATQVKNINAILAISYSNIQGGFSGLGNINQDPLFGPNNYYLSNGSPCIDAGNQSMVYYDMEDPSNLGNALFPSLALLNNDMGAYGGPCAGDLPTFSTLGLLTTLPENSLEKSLDGLYPNPLISASLLKFKLKVAQTLTIELFDISGRKVLSLADDFMEQGAQEVIVHRSGLSCGTYFLSVEGSAGLKETLKFVIAE